MSKRLTNDTGNATAQPVVMEVSDRWASARVRDVKNACDIAGRADLEPRYLASGLSVSEILQQLLWLHRPDQIEFGGAGPMPRN